MAENVHNNGPFGINNIIPNPQPSVPTTEWAERERWMRHRISSVLTTVPGLFFRASVVYVGLEVLGAAKLIGIDNNVSYWQALGAVSAFRALTSGALRVAGRGFNPQVLR